MGLSFQGSTLALRGGEAGDQDSGLRTQLFGTAFVCLQTAQPIDAPRPPLICSRVAPLNQKMRYWRPANVYYIYGCAGSAASGVSMSTVEQEKEHMRVLMWRCYVRGGNGGRA
jgi:hypothetical protein